MKGIILAGGRGTRLWPTTVSVNKQLLPVYDKPMIYYPLATLMSAGIRDVLVISHPDQLPAYQQLLADGTQWGMTIEYSEQVEPQGIAQALVIGKQFVGSCTVALILGDNVFHRISIPPVNMPENRGCAIIWGVRVRNPERYGVLSPDLNGGWGGIVEKPERPITGSLVVPGLYVYPKGVSKIAEGLKPSGRGEYEITDLNNVYFRTGAITIEIPPEDTAWFDCGSPDSLLEASSYVQAFQKRTGMLIGYPELEALQKGWISLDKYEGVTLDMEKCLYRDNLEAQL